MRMMKKTAMLFPARTALAFGLAIAALSLCSSSVLIAQAPAAGSKPPARVRTQLEGFELSSKSGQSKNQIGGASRDIGTPKLYAPILGKSYTTNPEFHWASPDVGAKVTFRLTNSDGQLVYETATTSDHLRYPGDAPGLAPGGNYKWTIVPENDMLGGPPPPVGLVIVSGAEREAILSDLKGAMSASEIAAVFVKHRVWYDAVQGYSDLIARMPSDTTARAARGQLYDQIDATKTLADADWRMVH